MRLLLTTFLFTITFYFGNSCSCILINTFCKRAQTIKSNPNGLIFIGNVIDRDTLEHSKILYKVKIEEILYGSVITGDVFHFEFKEYSNTEDEIWILGGSESQCLRHLSTRRAFFAPYYGTNTYGLSTCARDYIVFDENNIIRGNFEDSGLPNQINIDQIKNIIAGECEFLFSEFKLLIDRAVDIYPVPFNDFLKIESYFKTENINFTIYNLKGGKIYEAQLMTIGPKIDLRDFSAGVYCIAFTTDSYVYTKNILKI